MVSEEITDKIRSELVEIVERPKTDRARNKDYTAKLRGWLRNKDYRKEGVNREFVDSLWEEVNESFGAEDDAEKQRELLREYNTKIRNYFNYAGGKLTLQALSEEDFNPTRVTLNSKQSKKPWNERRALTEQFAGDLRVMPVMSKTARDNLLEMLEEVDNQVAREIGEDELKTIELLPQELVKGIRNIRLTENRDKMYAYWEKISELHPKLLAAIKELQQEVKDGADSEVAQLILELPNQDEIDENYLPNYIQEVPAKEIQMLSKGQRFRDWIATIIIGYEIKHKIKGPKLSEVSRDFKDLTGHSQRRRGAAKTTNIGEIPHSSGEKEKLPSSEKWGSQERLEHTETERLPHHVVSEGERKDNTSSWEYLDPIFWDSLNDGLDIPITEWELPDAREFVENAIIMARKRKMDNNEKQLKAKLLRMEKEALKTTSGAEKFYIPLTDWVKDNYTELVDKVDDVNKYTSIFFKQLADIMLASRGQERIQMERNYPIPPKDADTKTPLAAPPAGPYDFMRKPKPTGLRRTRMQAGKEAKKRTDFGNADIQTKIDKVMELVDAYYFVPILGKSTLFIDEIIPDFSHDLSGNYDFSTLGLLFSNNPAVQQSSGIGVNLEANFNYDDLLLIAQNLKSEISVEKQPNTNEYVKVVVELAQSLSNWSNDERRSAQFAADQLHKYLQGKDEVSMEDYTNLNQYRILDINAKLLFDEWIENQEDNKSVVMEMRVWLKSERFNALLKQREDMGINISKIERVAKDILDATSPSKLNNISEIGKSLLLAHDVIRKMQGKKVSYGKLSVNNLNDMDYLITKMENNHKVDITTNDVLNIIYSHNSLQSLSNNYGLSQDIIYEIKGLCR